LIISKLQIAKYEMGQLGALQFAFPNSQFESLYLFFRNLDDFAYVVAGSIMTAVGTRAMRHPEFMTVGALRERARREMIMGPPPIAARLGVSTFWIWHLRTPIFETPLDLKQRIQIWINFLLRTIAVLAVQIRPANRT
jgi:hypothetical protein